MCIRFHAQYSYSANFISLIASQKTKCTSLRDAYAIAEVTKKVLPSSQTNSICAEAQQKITIKNGIHDKNPSLSSLPLFSPHFLNDINY